MSLQVVDEHHELGRLVSQLEKLFVAIILVILIFLNYEALKLTAAFGDIHDQSCQLDGQIVFVHLETVEFQESKSVVEHKTHLIKYVGVL